METENTIFNLFGICQKTARGLQANSCYRTTRIWNELPKKVVNAKNINAFKSLLDEVWKDKATIYNPATTTSVSYRCSVPRICIFNYYYYYNDKGRSRGAGIFRQSTEKKIKDEVPNNTKIQITSIWNDVRVRYLPAEDFGIGGGGSDRQVVFKSELIVHCNNSSNTG